MSNKHLNLAWMATCQTTAQKLVLLNLADRANGDTGMCWPSLDMIVEETGLSKRSVIYAVNKLEFLELIQTTRNRGRKRRNNYTLTLKGAEVAPLDSEEKVQSTTVKGAKRDRKRCNGCDATVPKGNSNKPAGAFRKRSAYAGANGSAQDKAEDPFNLEIRGSGR